METFGTQRCVENMVGGDDDDDEAIRALFNATRDELLAQVAAMRRDWDRLNDFLNATALAYMWCSDYERRLERYNAAFEVLRLQGRKMWVQDDAWVSEDPFPCVSEIERLVEQMRRVRRRMQQARSAGRRAAGVRPYPVLEGW